VRVAIVFNRIIPALRYGGSDRVVWWLGKHLVRAGHSVVFVVPPGSTCDFAEVIHYAPEVPVGDQIPPGVDVVHDFALTNLDGHPSLTTLQGNMPPGARLPRNTAFISRNHAERHGGSVFVYNGIDPDDYGQPEWSASRDHLLFLALASWKVKNVRGAIRIARRARRSLSVVGGHRLNFNMGFRLTLDPNVRFHGVIGGEAKNRIINHSSALLFPVRWHEPFGIALIEALYFGCPVFGTPYGSLPEIVIPDVGVLADSETELARRLADLGQFNRRRCHQYACEEFSAELMTRRYLALYERVLNGESLHHHEPVTPDRPIRALLPMGR